MQGMCWELLLVVLVFASSASARAQQPAEDHLLFDFGPKQGQWMSVNDNVMGGVSRGGARPTDDGILDFSGVLSLENNGGFSSTRAALEPGALSGHAGLILRVRGDGRAYYVNLHTESRVSSGSWRAPLATRRDTWMEIRVPFSEFGWTVFGRRLPNRGVDPDQVQSLGFTIADKVEGPFRLQVDWIKAYGGAAREPDLVDQAAGMANLSIFRQAVDSAGLEGAIRGPGPMTVFAPTDAAFEKLPEGALVDLLREENRSQLRAILLNHVAPGRLLLAKREVQTLHGAPVSLDAVGPYRVGGATVVQHDLQASNGVLHVIDSVLVPSGAKPDTDTEAAELIDRAISIGVPLYNGGNAEACAAVYEVAVASLIGAESPGLSEDLQNTLRSVAAQASREQDRATAAWTLRRALDAARSQLQ